MLYTVVLLALFASVQGRAVNISNTWVLPEEGFPVFYRYFRDRISWYEADAVCQFHHANLVTVDTTAQYDAVRAYLKELDISSAVWVGLIRSNPDGDFTWTDYRGLSGDGYWSSAPDSRSAPLCAAADPAADYRWEARACGGPTVASFICELPVPQWALGNEGCMVRALPALTILYLPESAAIQLTADCGLAGVKRLQCTGNVKHQDLVKDLSCSEEEEITTVISVTSMGTAWSTISDSVFTDQDNITESTTEEIVTTEHEDDINQSSTNIQSSTARNINFVTKYNITTRSKNSGNLNRETNIVIKNLDITLGNDNNLQNNIIPKVPNDDNYLSNEQIDRIEDEKHVQHKMLHEEIARLGNLDNIFTQPTDHFIPPLVMAKAKISNDMVVLSLQEKHAQQMAEHLRTENIQIKQNDHIVNSSTEGPNFVTINDTIYMQTFKSKDSTKKDKNKTTLPKKYSEKALLTKEKMHKLIEMKSIVSEKITTPTFVQTEATSKQTITTSLPFINKLDENSDSSLDLTVLLKDLPDINEEKPFYNYSGDISKLEVIKNNTQSFGTDIMFLDIEATEEVKEKNPGNIYERKILNITLNNETVNTTIIPDVHTSMPTVFENSTTVLFVEDNTSITSLLRTNNESKYDNITMAEIDTEITTKPFLTKSANISLVSVDSTLKNDTTVIINAESTTTKPVTITTTALPILTSIILSENLKGAGNFVKEATTTDSPHLIHMETINNINIDIHEDIGNSSSSDTIDDYNSPLLSGANEPIRRPNRSRRPQTPPNRSKFNPFRILG